METINLPFVFGAGLLSVLSPCVLPVIPIVVTGSAKDHNARPLLIVAGLTLSFMTMGVLSSLFGSFLGQWMYSIEKIAAILIIIMGILLALNVNIFKRITLFNKLASRSSGKVNGLFLGLILGLIWIPCVGPILGSVLTMVASEGKVASGLFYLFIYSAGFAVPMLLAGYASQFFRSKLGGLSQHQQVINIISGVILVALGLFIFFKGMLGFSALSF